VRHGVDQGTLNLLVAEGLVDPAAEVAPSLSQRSARSAPAWRRLLS